MLEFVGSSDSAKKVFLTQMRVIGALILREMRVRFGRTQFGYLWAVVEPLAYIAAFASIFYFAERHPPIGTSMPAFFATGILPFFLFRNLGNQLAGAFEANRALLMYPIVVRLDTVVARAILEMATLVFIILIVFLFLAHLDLAAAPADVPRMIEALILMGLFGFGIGLLNAVIIEQISSWQNLFRLAMMPLLFVSGVFFTLESVPPNVRYYISWNPIIHGVEMFRDGYYPNFRSAGLDKDFLVWSGIISTVVALAAERVLRGRSPG